MKAINLGSGRVLSTVLKLIIPAMIAQFINVLYSIVDRMYVGNIEGIGDTALAAVGVCAPITTLISSFAFLIGTGGAPLFAMSLGEGREDNARKILANAAYALAALGVVVAAIFLIFQRPILFTFGASDTTYDYAREYLMIYAAGAVFSITGTGLNQYITAQGYSGIAMTSTIIGAVANIALDPLFIFVFNMNVAPDNNSAKRNSAGARRRRRRHVDNVSTVVQAFFSLTSMPMLGISEGSQPVLSYAYGAKNERLIKRAELWITVACLVFTTFMTVMSIFCAQPFVRLFTQNAEIAEKSVWGIRVFMMGVIPLSFQYAFVDCFTALGQPKYAITLSLARKVVFFLGALIAFPLIWDVSAAFYAEPFADIAAAILTSICFAIFFPKVIRRRINGEDDLKKRRFHHRRQKTAE